MSVKNNEAVMYYKQEIWGGQWIFVWGRGRGQNDWFGEHEFYDVGITPIFKFTDII